MLNVKYVLHDIPDLPNPFLVPNMLPRFWIVDEYEIVSDRSSMPARIADPAFDVGRRVLLEESPGFPSANADTAKESPGRLLNYVYDANDIDVEVEASRSCLLIHSENWFPYWHAFEMQSGKRGQELPILRANGTLRAIPLQPGKHTVGLRFKSEPYERGKLLTLSTLGFIAVAGFILRRRRGSFDRGPSPRAREQDS
jgi:hypothetical protein